MDIGLLPRGICQRADKSELQAITDMLQLRETQGTMSRAHPQLAEIVFDFESQKARYLRRVLAKDETWDEYVISTGTHI